MLPLNKLQHLIVKSILNHAIKYKRKMYLDFGKQLLIYIKSERRVGKVVKTIEMGFILFNKKKQFLISALTGSAANSRGCQSRISKFPFFYGPVPVFP